MKSIIYSVVAIFTLVCFAQAQQAPDSVSVAYDSNPSSLQLRAQTGPNNSVTLTWRGGDPISPGFTIYESIRPGYYVVIDCRPQCSKLYGGRPLGRNSILFLGV